MRWWFPSGREEKGEKEEERGEGEKVSCQGHAGASNVPSHFANPTKKGERKKTHRSIAVPFPLCEPEEELVFFRWVGRRFWVVEHIFLSLPLYRRSVGP